MQPVDYDERLHRDYARGRALPTQHASTWAAAFERELPQRRPLAGLDLGCGTGRFSPLLADAFGPVVGVDPSSGMLGVARAESAHPLVDYRDGSATAIPADDASFDYALLFLVWHHVRAKDDGAEELARVLRPGATAIVRLQLSDAMPDLWWLRHFPGGPELDAAMYRSLDAELTTFGAHGFVDPRLRTVTLPGAETLREELDRLELRSLSIFEHMTEDQLSAGFASLRAAVAASPPATLVPPTTASMLVLTRA